MKMTDDTKPITIGELAADLKKYEKKYSDYDVVCWAPGDSTLCVVGAGLDKDGNLRIELNEMGDDGGGFSVNDLLAALKDYDKDTKVYMAGCGLYLNFKLNHDGNIFSDASEEDEIVGCDATVFGKYEEKKQGFLTEAEKRELAEKAIKKQREERIYGIALMVMAVAIAVWLIYNVYALIAHTGEPVWENIMWIVICIVLLVIDAMTLYHSKDKDHI